ncbi:SDR family oxidoreductase [Lentilitoribacter sp. EG35]|jgi:NAD(P)-dependent dehydrogenase (short-subunit alcohol dehydrogenase family)|uniref:SDR family oxidoreductase n=1 Tax=Lentilitoribacter sp. EG35 TaxID=3234192 RepID=UPI003460A150
MENGLIFTGRRILVTGATGGIGSAVVRELVQHGATVLAHGRNTDTLEALATETGCETITFNIEEEDSVASALNGIEIWGVVNSAGFGGEIATPMSTDIEVFDRVISVNTRGALLVTKYATTSMVAAGKGGAIVNISSQAALIALWGHISYAASKAALDSITRSSSLELGQYGIRVNSVNPTVVLTDISRDHWTQPHIAGPFLDRMPLGRWATPEEVARPITFLLSDWASMITGVTLPIDGGFTIV